MDLVGRFAPSPTGELHLGNARTALAAWLGAHGRVLMRIEDLDPPRVLAGAEARILEDTAWLGLPWEGPVARQGDRLPGIAAALDRLVAAGRVYACTCSRADLRALASAPHGEDGPIYPGTCRDRGLPLDRGALRFRVAPGEVRFEDAVFGPQAQDVANAVGDFVIRRADGLFAYQLAVVVDDALMGVGQVVRGADLLGSTARQLQLQEALGYARPAYAHVPLVLDEAGGRLAKRDGATAVRALRDAGVAPGRVIGLLAWSLGLLPEPAPCLPATLLDAFAWARITREPWRCGPADLAWLLAQA